MCVTQNKGEYVFINLTNHPSQAWQKKQYEEATSSYGEVVDLPFPVINAASSEEDIRTLAEDYLKKIEEINPDAVMLAGEYTFTFMMVNELLKRGIIVFASATERVAKETLMEDGTLRKNVCYDFVKFRKYTIYHQKEEPEL